MKSWLLFFKDKNAVLVLCVAVILYAFYYPLPYLNGVTRDIPVAVTDFDNTATSRQLTGFFDASSNLKVFAYDDMISAKQALASEKVYSILEIPSGFENEILAGRTSTIGLFSNGSYFMVHSEISRAVFMLRQTNENPMEIGVKTMFNSSMRYDNYVVPAVLIVLMQQTMVIGICILGAAVRRFVYLLHYGILLCFYLFVVYPIFGFNAYGKFIDIAIFALVFFIACMQMGFFFARFFKQKESVMQVFLYASLPFIFISGFSWPKSSISEFLHYALFWVPCEHAISAWISIQQMGAKASEVSAEIINLGILAAGYSILSLIFDRFKIRCQN
ncbi:MAG: ABC transporter permease [Fibromonadales bacterium]|nr:ABC transporter permease [Fibromonadales bacterium]